jgi:alpha/beta superfamily hydrolase
MEEKIAIQSEHHQLEGLFGQGTSDKGVVITHPHPLYGGDMHNPVVTTMMQAYQKHDYTTLRFNFRGTGNSQGAYADGLGEQEDVRAALAHLSNFGIRHLTLAGYSFGAWVNAHLTCQDNGIEAMVMVSPPAAFLDFGAIASLDFLNLIITGSRDEIAPSGLIHELIPKWNPEARFEIIEGADHFYGGYLERLKGVLASCI